MYRQLLMSMALLFAVLPARGATTDLDCRLAFKPQQYSIEASNLLEAIAKVGTEFHIPLGIEWAAADGGQPIKLSWRGASVREILDSVVGSNPKYGIEYGNGVVHVFSTALRSDQRNFLNIRLPDFQVQDEFVTSANRRLLEHVRRVANPVPEETLPDGGCAGSMGIGRGDKKATFTLRNASLREILDQLLASADYRVWIVSFQPELRTTSRGFFVTNSVYGGQSEASVQPRWDLLFWGFDPVRRDWNHEWKFKLRGVGCGNLEIQP